jgi:hypothetical protein
MSVLLDFCDIFFIWGRKYPGLGPMVGNEAYL